MFSNNLSTFGLDEKSSSHCSDLLMAGRGQFKYQLLLHITSENRPPTGPHSEQQDRSLPK